MKLALGCDHGGYLLKEEVKKHLDEKGIEYADFGCHSTESCDYPDMADAPCKAVTSGECTFALLFCGTGVDLGDVKSFRAGATRMHNDANVLCMGGRVVGPGLACQMVDEFLSASFEGGRHQRRVDKLTALEQ